MRIPHYWLYIFLLATAALFFFFKSQQAPLSYDFAPQFDGNDYKGAYDYFSGIDPEYEVASPFHKRILVPWLAASMGSGQIVEDFQWLNLAFSLLGIWALFSLWRMLGLELKWFLFGFGWLLLHWTGMLRLNAFDPITVDVPLFGIQALFLWLILKRKFTWLLLLAPLATLQKESFLGLLILLLIYGRWHNHKQQDAFFDLKWIGLALLLSISSLLLTDYWFVPSEPGRGAIIMILYQAKEALLNPFELVRWATAAMIAFGPLLILGLRQALQRRHYDNRKNLLALFSGLYLLYGLLAGGDMTRIIFLGFPFIMTWLMYELKEWEVKRIILLALWSLPITLLIFHIPDPAFEWDRWQTWYPEFAPTEVVLIMLAYGLLSFVAMLKLHKSPH